LHVDDGFEVPDVSLELIVVRGDVAGQEKQLATGMRLLDAGGQYVFAAELVVPDTQTGARLPRLHRVRAVGKGETHVLQRTGWGQKFWSIHWLRT